MQRKRISDSFISRLVEVCSLVRTIVYIVSGRIKRAGPRVKDPSFKLHPVTVVIKIGH